MIIIDEIREDPDSVLADDEKMKVVIQDPELAVELLKSKEVYNLDVNVDGDNIAMVRPIEPLVK